MDQVPPLPGLHFRLDDDSPDIPAFKGFQDLIGFDKREYCERFAELSLVELQRYSIVFYQENGRSRGIQKILFSYFFEPHLRDWPNLIAWIVKTLSVSHT